MRRAASTDEAISRTLRSLSRASEALTSRAAPWGACTDTASIPASSIRRQASSRRPPSL